MQSQNSVDDVMITNSIFYTVYGFNIKIYLYLKFLK